MRKGLLFTVFKFLKYLEIQKDPELVNKKRTWLRSCDKSSVIETYQYKYFQFVILQMYYGQCCIDNISHSQ